MSNIVLVSSPWLSEHSSKIRAKAVPWDGYQRANLVSPSELALLKKIDRQPLAKQQQVFEKEQEVYAGLFEGLLGKLVRVDTVQAVLVGMGDLIGESQDRLNLFYNLQSQSSELPFAPLIKAISLSDEFIQLKATQLLTVLISSSPKLVSDSTLHPLLSVLANLLQAPSPHSKEIALQSLALLLSVTSIRSSIWALEDTSIPVLSSLSKILRSISGASPAGQGVVRDANPQVMYWVGFCFWELTFDRQVCEGIDKKLNLVPHLLSLAQSSPKQKVLRITLATFRNLITLAPQVNVPAMLAARVAPFVESLKGRKLGEDTELEDDLNVLGDVLKEARSNLSTWDEYASEVESGHLAWSPIHESEDFWKENATKLNEKDGKLIKILVDLLKASDDPVVLAVACADIGHYVKNYESGKKLVNNMGAKTRVMALMTHENPDVRYRALLAVQRLISLG
ncbi:Vacuolar H-ATPase V1 sector, subunit H [Phaffia rhodozyma]|uniref:V-type proton ATPase subunit H n=1 Tax=Phaffia rhodozyma TaxID=264483 RepID=A0A0F7SGI7_PHARH|nr:Vacuolar H-ATPase V1 sector, subunit H [Phaffia rhodozyma]